MSIKESELIELTQMDKSSGTTTGTTDITPAIQIKLGSDVLIDPTVLEEPPADADSLTRVVDTKKKLAQVKQSLSSIVKTLNEDPSLITRAANFWSGITWWEKALIGVGISGVPLAVGLFAHIGVLLTLGSATGVFYTAGNIVLDDHHTHNVSVAKRVENGVSGLADILGFIINLLDSIHQKFSEEIKKFQVENSRLTDNIDNLQDQVESLVSQVELLSATERLLRETKEGLEQTATDLAESTVKQTVLIEQNEKQLTEARKTYEKSQIQLRDKVIELTSVKDKLGLQIEQANLVANTLKGTVDTLSGTVISSDKEREVFKQKLEGFFQDKGASLDKAALRISQAELELEQVKEQLKEISEKYKQLLARQEDQVKRMEELNKSLHTSVIIPKESVKGLHTHGMHAHKKPMPLSTQQENIAPTLVTAN